MLLSEINRYKRNALYSKQCCLHAQDDLTSLLEDLRFHRISQNMLIGEIRQAQYENDSFCICEKLVRFALELTFPYFAVVVVEHLSNSSRFERWRRWRISTKTQQSGLALGSKKAVVDLKMTEARCKAVKERGERKFLVYEKLLNKITFFITIIMKFRTKACFVSLKFFTEKNPENHQDHSWQIPQVYRKFQGITVSFFGLFRDVYCLPLKDMFQSCPSCPETSVVESERIAEIDQLHDFMLDKLKQLKPLPQKLQVGCKKIVCVHLLIM